MHNTSASQDNTKHDDQHHNSTTAPTAQEQQQQEEKSTESTPLKDSMHAAATHGSLLKRHIPSEAENANVAASVDVRGPDGSYGTATGGNAAVDDHGYSSDSDVTSPTTLKEQQGEDGEPIGFFDKMIPPGGVGAAVASLLSSIVTPSMLSIPLAFSEGGSTFCICTIMFCIVMTVFSTRFLCIASAESGMKSYEGISRYYYGYKCRTLTRLILFFYNLGSSVVYLRFIADSIAPVLEMDFIPSIFRQQGGVYVMLLVWVFVTPLTFDARISSMRYKSFFANFLTLSIVMIIVYRYYNPLPYMLKHQHHTHPPESNSDYGIFIPQVFVAPMIIFSYELQSNLVSVYNELTDRTLSNIIEALGWTLLAATGFYMSLGLYGSATFGDRVLGNLLNNYDPNHDLLISYALTACCISAGVCFVFVLFPCRHAMLGAHEHSQAMLMKFGGGISLLACLLAVFVPNVSAAISLLGSLCSSTLSMTLPSLFLFKVAAAGSPMVTRTDRIAAAILLPCGLLFGVVGSLMSIAVIIAK